MLNATYLFRYPARRRHHSESWWSALFSMLVLHLAKHSAREIPIKEYRSGPPWTYMPAGTLDVAGLTFSDVFVEAPLTEHLANHAWPVEFDNLRPDITICQPQRKRVILIENKTIGACIGAQLDTHLAARDHFRNQGWAAETMFLISIGYEVDREWQTIERTHTPVILWENVLRVVNDVPWLRNLFDCELVPYYDIPETETENRQP